MFSLAIETSSRVGSIAIVYDGMVIDQVTFPHGLQHAATILPSIDVLCRTYGIKPPELRKLLISIGPGSFTGLRVAVTLVKTLSMVTGATIYAVPTPRVIVENLSGAADPFERIENALVVLDARRGHIFATRYLRSAATNNVWIEQLAPHLTTMQAAIRELSGLTILTGEGIAFHAASIPSDESVFVAPQPMWQPGAAMVAKVAISSGVLVTTDDLEPLYIRLAEAEEKRLIKEGKITLPKTDEPMGRPS